MRRPAHIIIFTFRNNAVSSLDHTVSNDRMLLKKCIRKEVEVQRHELNSDYIPA
jgi:hypothetical protein